MKLSDHRALQGALLLSAAIFTICQARPQSTGTSTSALGNTEAASHSQENDKTEEEAIRVRLEQGEDGNVQDTTASTFSSSFHSEAVGRAKDASSTHLGDSIHSLTSQLLASRYHENGQDNAENSSDDSMVEEDIRTPPKLKSQLHKYKNNRKPVIATAEVDFMEDEGTKGVAVPVIIDEDDELEKTMEKLSDSTLESTQVQSTTPKRKYIEPSTTKKPRTTTTTVKPNHDSTASDESSTWILLSDSSAPTTPSFHKKKKNPTSTTQRITTTHSRPELLKTSASYSFASSSVNHNIKKPQRLTATTTTASPNTKTTHSPSSGEVSSNAQVPEIKTAAENSQSSVTENLKATVTGNTNSRNNNTVSNRTRKPPVQAMTNKVKSTTATPTPEAEITKTKDKVMFTSRPPTTTTTKLPEVTTSAAVVEEVTTAVELSEDHPETTTKRNRRPQQSSGDNKKRKKNKHRRRRPSKRPNTSDSDSLESKTTDNNATSSNPNQKIATKERPLTTRIYNYLAREVMPSFGVGLLGLVVTAGLAGLIMYPFGGVAPSRRTYEEQYGQHSPYYYRSEYDQGEVEGQSEEEVFGKLLEGMNDKGEFTYPGFKDDSTAYGSASPADYSSTLYRTADNVAPSYNTQSQIGAIDSRVSDATRLKGATSVSQMHPVYAEGSSQEATSSNSYKYSPDSQQYYPGSTNVNRNSHYSSMATRSSDVSGGVDSQSPLYVGSISMDTKSPQHYVAGSVHIDNNPHGSENSNNYRRTQGSSTGHYKVSNTAGTGSYPSSNYKGSVVSGSSQDTTNTYKTVHEELPSPQAYTMYDGFKGVQGQNYENVQVDTKYSVHPQDSTGAQDSSYSHMASPQRKHQQTQYRDAYGSQPWLGSSLTFTTGSPQKVSTTHEDTSKNVSKGVTKVQNITKVGLEDAMTATSDISSRLSPTLQKRVYGIIEHGPRSLRHRRSAPQAEDEQLNEIDSMIPSSVKDYQIMPTDQNLPSSTAGTDQETTTDYKQTDSPSTTESTTAIDLSTQSLDPVTTLLNVKTTTSESSTATTLRSEASTNAKEETEESEEEENDNDEEVYVTTSATKGDKIVENDEQDDGNVTEAPQRFSLLELFRRIARFKIRLGLNLLRSTSEAFTNYIEKVQKRLEKNDTSKGGARDIKTSIRIKRSTSLKSTSSGGKKLLELLKEYNKKYRAPSRRRSG